MKINSVVLKGNKGNYFVTRDGVSIISIIVMNNDNPMLLYEWGQHGDLRQLLLSFFCTYENNLITYIQQQNLCRLQGKKWMEILQPIGLILLTPKLEDYLVGFWEALAQVFTQP